MREILKAGRHLLELINEVLDLSRIEAGKLALRMEPVALDELIDECVTLVEPSVLRQGLNLSRHVAPCINRRVLADRLRLKQVLLNLLTNAIKYNRVGGEIQITCDILGNGRVRISVRDSGPGLSPQQQAELFTAFHRLGRENSAIEGTGIGLVISKRLVELQGGAIGVDSQVGEGSTFWIELPEAESANENPDAEAGSAARTEEDVGALPPAQARRHKVLYVEDNPANLRLVEQILSRRGDIHLLCSEEPMRGLEMARTEQPELILLDINLPNMDGYEVLQRLQADPATRAIPVVAISANAMPVDVARGLEAVSWPI